MARGQGVRRRARRAHREKPRSPGAPPAERSRLPGSPLPLLGSFFFACLDRSVHCLLAVTPGVVITPGTSPRPVRAACDGKFAPSPCARRCLSAARAARSPPGVREERRVLRAPCRKPRPAVTRCFRVLPGSFGSRSDDRRVEISIHRLASVPVLAVDAGWMCAPALACLCPSARLGAKLVIGPPKDAATAPRPFPPTRSSSLAVCANG